MNGIDPKWVFYLGILVTIESAIGQGAVKLTNVVPDAWAPFIVGWCTLLAFIGNVLMTALAGYSSKTAGPLVKPVVLLAVILGSLFAFTGDARAQGKLTGNLVKDIAAATGKPATVATTATSTDSAIGSFGDSVRKITKELVDKAIADVTAASADADKHNDLISKPCWDANLKLLQGLPSQWENPPADIGIALGIQIQRDLLNSITGNDTTSLKVACAALWGDQLKIVANVGALLGIRIATGGLF